MSLNKKLIGLGLERSDAPTYITRIVPVGSILIQFQKKKFSLASVLYIYIAIYMHINIQLVKVIGEKVQKERLIVLCTETLYWST